MRTPDTYHQAGLRRGTATSNFHAGRDNLIHPVAGCCWAAQEKPERLRANYHKRCGVRQFHACYSVGDDTMWGVVRQKKGTDNSLRAIKSCRAARPRRRANLCDPRQPLRPQGQEDPHLVREEQRRALLHAHVLVMGQSHRVSFSLRCGTSCSTTPIIPTTTWSPAGCMPTCAGATSTAAIPPCASASAGSVLGCAPNASAAGADQLDSRRPKPPRASSASLGHVLIGRAVDQLQHNLLRVDDLRSHPSPTISTPPPPRTTGLAFHGISNARTFVAAALAATRWGHRQG